MLEVNKTSNDIQELIARIEKNKQIYIGYPGSTDLSNEKIYPILNQYFNNIGDPFEKGIPFNSFGHERAVINFFKDIYNSDANNTWGYITNCSSEAILHACWNAKNNFKKDKTIIIASEYTHYCIDKVANILGLSIHRVKSNDDGSIDTIDLENYLKSRDKSNDQAYIFVATAGSTITSSIDDYRQVKLIFNKYTKNLYTHLDGAFDGAFLPLIDKYTIGDGFDSVNISGHKFIGSPCPSGIFITLTKFISKKYIEIIANNDVTIGGSRNGLSPILIYNRIESLGGKNGLIKRYNTALEKADLFLKILLENNIKAWKNPKAITIVLENIPDIIFKKWYFPKYQHRSTLTCLPKFSQQMLEQFIWDIKNIDKIDFTNSKTYAEDIMPL